MVCVAREVVQDGPEVLGVSGHRSLRRVVPRGRRWIYAAAVTIVALALVEGLARVREVWFPPIPYDPTAGFLASAPVFVPCDDDPDRLCTNPERGITFHHESFLADKPGGDVRIVALGGSSVANLEGCSDRAPEVCLDSLAARLARACPACAGVEIINCGGNSYGSGRVAVVLDEVVGYEPDLLLLYTGHNEFEDSEQLRQTPLRTVRMQRFLGNSALYRLMRDLALVAKARGRKTGSGGWFGQGSDPELSGAKDFSPPEVLRRMESFESNLGRIVETGRRAGAEVIIGTVPSNLYEPQVHGWDDLYWEIRGEYDAGRFAEGRERMERALDEHPRHQSSPRENAIIRRVADQLAVPLADVERAVERAEPHGVPGETLFFDHCHLNMAGNALLLQTFEEEIVRWMARRGLTSPPSELPLGGAPPAP